MQKDEGVSQEVRENTKFFIGTYATKSYLYCLEAWLQRMLAAASHHQYCNVVFVTDKSKECEKAAQFIGGQLKKDWLLTHVALEIEEDGRSEAAMRNIAKMHDTAMHFARMNDAEAFWSLEIDNLPHADALKMSEWVLNIPDQYYDIAMVTYPNEAFLGGHGDWNHSINEDFLENERQTSKKFKLVKEAAEKRIDSIKKSKKKPKNKQEIEANQKIIDKETRRLVRLHKRLKKYPPAGNIWDVIAKYGWRRRGWLNNAYPAIGRGAILETDWVGMGCTLLSKRALSHAQNYGYTGKGTNDLFMSHKKWGAYNLRKCVITHTLCDHAKRKADKDGKEFIELIQAYHEPLGEYMGHLRTEEIII